jgi:hypothetical protein
MANKVFRVTCDGFYIGTFSTMNKAIKRTGHTNKSGWFTADLQQDGYRLWETYKPTGYEILETLVQ